MLSIKGSSFSQRPYYILNEGFDYGLWIQFLLFYPIIRHHSPFTRILHRTPLNFIPLKVWLLFGFPVASLLMFSFPKSVSEPKRLTAAGSLLLRLCIIVLKFVLWLPASFSVMKTCYVFKSKKITQTTFAMALGSGRVLWMFSYSANRIHFAQNSRCTLFRALFSCWSFTYG